MGPGTALFWWFTIGKTQANVNVCTLFEGTVRTTENTSATNAVNKESVPQKERKSWFTYALAKTNLLGNQ